MSVRERMRLALNKISADTTGCYELIGIDCIVDDHGKVWLLECNLSPSLEVVSSDGGGSDVEAGIKRQVVSDLVSMKGLNEGPSPWVGLEGRSRFSGQHDFEIERSGSFTAVFPAHDAEVFLPHFPVPRHADKVLAELALGKSIAWPTPRPDPASEFYLNDELLLYSPTTRDMLVPNQTATWIWLKSATGQSAEECAADLAAAAQQTSDSDETTIERWSEEVSNALADWGQAGLLTAPDTALSEPSLGPIRQRDWESHHAFVTPAGPIGVRSAVRAVAERLNVLPLQEKNGHQYTAMVDVVESDKGYAILASDRDDGAPFLHHASLKLSEVLPAIITLSIEIISKSLNDSTVLRGCYLTAPTLPSLFIPSLQRGNWDDLAENLRTIAEYSVRGSAAILSQEKKEFFPLALPSWAIDETGAANSEWPGRGPGSFRKPDALPIDSCSPPDWILIPSPTEENTTARIERLSGPDAVVNIWPALQTATHESAVHQCIDWLGERQIGRVTYSNMHEAANAIAGLAVHGS